VTPGKAPERMLTIAEAAGLTSYDEKVILDWLARGLPFVAAGSGRLRPRRKDVRIRASALWTWVEQLEMRRTPAPEPAPAGKGRKGRPTPAPTGGLSAWRAVKAAEGE
jgi:hypothetical protein